MKTDRLIGILSVLMQKDKTTAAELAELFEVSRRTVSRDIETLCMAGIPVETVRGFDGGIRIMEGFRMDRAVLTSKDMQMIIAGLRGLDSVSGSGFYTQLMEKIRTGSSSFVSGRDSILIDLSSWNRKTLVPKLEVIQKACAGRHMITFRYSSPSSESERTVEPYYLIFRWSGWYLWAWDESRNDYRLFKLNRMENISELPESFEYRDAPVPDLSDEKIFPARIRAKVLFAPEMKWRLREEAGTESYTETDEGKLLFTADFSDTESLVTWIMTFGADAEILEPAEARIMIALTVKKMAEIYGE